MRIPVLFSALQPDPDAVWLVETGLNAPFSGYAEHFTLPPAKLGQLLGCYCCTPRGPASDALGRLFRARATGTAPFFKQVIVLASASGQAAIREAIAGEVITAARYRLASDPTQAGSPSDAQ